MIYPWILVWDLAASEVIRVSNISIMPELEANNRQARVNRCPVQVLRIGACGKFEEGLQYLFGYCKGVARRRLTWFILRQGDAWRPPTKFIFGSGRRMASTLQNRDLEFFKRVLASG